MLGGGISLRRITTRMVAATFFESLRGGLAPKDKGRDSSFSLLGEDDWFAIIRGRVDWESKWEERSMVNS